jgi:hypothetical protein
MLASIKHTGMYMPQKYWIKYKELRLKYPEVNTGFADKNMEIFIAKEKINER